MTDTSNLTFDANGSLPKASEAATKGGYTITAPPTDNVIPYQVDVRPADPSISHFE